MPTSPLSDLVEKIQIEKDEMDNGFIIKPLAKFNEKLFSKREMRLIQKISLENLSMIGREMVKLTHEENSPWDVTFNKMSAKNEKIEYSLILNDLSTEDANLIKSIAAEIQKEQDEFLQAFN